jgi:phosphotransferase system HPr (HPr) family protein
MTNSLVTRTVVIQNANGFHARPAERFARQAMQYESRIEVLCRNERIDARSIMLLLTMGATPGTELTIEASGPDAQQAVDALSALVESGFVEEERTDDHGATQRSPGN